MGEGTGYLDAGNHAGPYPDNKVDFGPVVFVLPAPVAGVLPRTLGAERVIATSRNGFLGRRSLRLAGRKPCADTEEPKQRSDSYRARKRAA